MLKQTVLKDTPPLFNVFLDMLTGCILKPVVCLCCDDFKNASHHRVAY